MTIESLLRIDADLPLNGVAASSGQLVAGLATAGLTVGTTVLTLDGEMPVQFLAPGDRVVTRSGAKVVKSVEVSILSEARMIRVSASALGHDRPEADCFLAPAQKIILRDWRAKALYGQEVAMVEAQRLVDGDYIRPETVAEIRLFTLAFDQDEVIYAGGIELLCETVKVGA